MQGPQRWEDHPGVTAGVRPTEVVEVNLVRTTTERHAVGEGARWQAVAIGVGKHIHRRFGSTSVGPHSYHVGPRRLMRNELDRSWKRDIAADMVTMAMSIDEGGDGMTRQFSDLL